MAILEHLEPKKVFHFFEKISNIPRGSGNEQAVSDYLVQFAKSRGLFCLQDAANNVLIKKPATAGLETAPAVILQGHMDMVCEKGSTSSHDFLKDPLSLRIDGDYLKADDTTLGGDDGIAVAFALALLDAQDLPHPALEVVITTDEEVGMNGAHAFDASVLEGKYFINIDSEEEGKFLVSCCGGARAQLALPALRETAPSQKSPFALTISGLYGGHSGCDIDKQRANANKLLGRVLTELGKKVPLSLYAANGGSMDNAICRDSQCVLLLNENEKNVALSCLDTLQQVLQHEYADVDEGVCLALVPQPVAVKQVFTKATTDRLIAMLLLMPYGVLTMSHTIPGLVESSNNIGVVETTEESILFSCAVRSSVESRKELILDQLQALADLTGAKLDVWGNYPGWEYTPESSIRQLFLDTYQELFGIPGEVTAIHAGVECGLFSKKKAGLDMISLGPNMHDVHTPKERISISSVARTWKLLTAALAKIR